MRKIKVLYMISSLRACGPVNVLYNIVRYMDFKIFDIYVLTLSPVKGRSREAEFASLGVHVTNLNLSRMAMATYGRRSVKKVVQDISPQIIHAHCFRSTLLVQHFKEDCYIFATIHNYPHKDFPLLYGKWIGSWMCKKYFSALDKIGCPIACSESITKELLDKYKIKTQFIQNGIDLEVFHEFQSEEKNEIRRELGISVDQKIIVSVGSLIERKNPLFIIKAFKNSTIYATHYLYFLGDGSLRGLCEELADDHIVFLGNVEDVNKYLNIANFFISASKAEGMPNAVLEAMAMGVPVLLSDIEPHKEILALNKKSGKLFEVDNMVSLDHLLDQIPFFNVLEMSKNAKELITLYFSAKDMSRKYQKKYIKTIKDN